VVYQMTQFSLCNSFSASRNYNLSAYKCVSSAKANEVSVNLIESKTFTVDNVEKNNSWLHGHIPLLNIQAC